MITFILYTNIEYSGKMSAQFKWTYDNTRTDYGATPVKIMLIVTSIQMDHRRKNLCPWHHYTVYNSYLRLFNRYYILDL